MIQRTLWPRLQLIGYTCFSNSKNNALPGITFIRSFDSFCYHIPFGGKFSANSNVPRKYKSVNFSFRITISYTNNQVVNKMASDPQIKNSNVDVLIIVGIRA